METVSYHNQGAGKLGRGLEHWKIVFIVKSVRFIYLLNNYVHHHLNLSRINKKGLGIKVSGLENSSKINKRC